MDSNKGFGALAIATIPAALGLGGMYWIAVASGVLQLGHQNRINRRVAEIVHSPQPQEGSLKITIGKNSTLFIDRAVEDGEHLVVYFHNQHSVRYCYEELHWKLSSPDDTIISSGSQYGDDPGGGMEAGEKQEIQADMHLDDRAKSLRIFMSAQSACGDD